MDSGEWMVPNWSPWGAEARGTERERKQTFPRLAGHFVIMCRSSASDSRKPDNICFQRPLTLESPEWRDFRSVLSRAGRKRAE